MTTITQAPAELDLAGVAGDPFGLVLNIALTDATGHTIPWSAFTDASVEVVVSGAVDASLAPTITSPQDDQLALAWNAAQTATIGGWKTVQWALSATIEGVGPESLVAGTLTFSPATQPGPSGPASANLAVAVGTATASLVVTLGSAGVQQLTAADGTITVGGTATDVTVKVTPNVFDAFGAAAAAQAAAEAASDPVGAAAAAQAAAEAASDPVGAAAAVQANLTAETSRATAAEGARWKTRGTWTGPGTVYAVNDIVDGPAGFVGGLYRCITAHTSGASFSGPGANWETVRDPNGTFGALNADMHPLGPVLAKLLAGQNIIIDWMGDSVLEGHTASSFGAGVVTYTGAASTDNDCASLVCNAIAKQYGVSVLKNNRAVSGRTVATGFINDFATAIADAADLYVISFGKNDVGSDSATNPPPPGNGYPRAASISGLTHLVRKIRKTDPLASVLILSENPDGSFYNGGAGANPLLVLYNAQLRIMAGRLGCAWADGYGAFSALGNWDAYISGGSTGVHPNDAGHALLAQTVEALFPTIYTGSGILPALPDQPIGTEHYYDRRNWSSKVTVTARSAGQDGMPLTGTWTGTPNVTSTPGDFADIYFFGSEILLQLAVGVGGPVITVAIDGLNTYTNLDLTNAVYATNANALIPITGLTPTFHHLRVTLVSGTMTLSGFYTLKSPTERFTLSSARVTLTGTWTHNASNATFYDRDSNASTLAGTIAFDFVGTDLYVACNLIAHGGSIPTITPTIDGSAKAAINVGGQVGITSTQTGILPIATGLEYGHHTASLAIAPNSGTFTGGEFYVFDATRLGRPRRQRGTAAQGEAVTYGSPFGGPPSVHSVAKGAATAPFYTSAETASGFTVSGGTAGIIAGWEAEGDLVAF